MNEPDKSPQTEDSVMRMVEKASNMGQISPQMAERAYWNILAQAQKLDVFDSVCAFMDLHRFGQVLRDVNWNLEAAQQRGLIETLAYFYRMGASSIMSPSHEERILVLNDGIARVVDLPSGIVMDALAAYVRDILTTHCQLVYGFRSSKLKLGIRTVFTGGERIQYAPSLEPHEGESHSIEADAGERIDWSFGQQNIFNPFHFQMNTAFSRAYLIEKAGSKAGIQRNRAYLDHLWLEVWKRTFKEGLRIRRSGSTGTITLHYRGSPWLELEFDSVLTIQTKEFESNGPVYQLSAMKEFSSLGDTDRLTPLIPDEIIAEFDRRKAEGWQSKVH